MMLDGVARLIARHDDLGVATQLLVKSLPHGYLVGGIVRDAMLGSVSRPKDLDVICSHADLNRVWSQGIEGFEISANRHGNVRLRRGVVSVDLFAPQTFFHGFDTLVGALSYFDIDLNAVACRIDGTGEIIDPLNAAENIRRRLFRAIPSRWFRVDEEEAQAVLLARMLKFWRKHPDFTCLNPEIVKFDIATVFQRHPLVLSHHLGGATDGAASELVDLLARSSSLTA